MFKSITNAVQKAKTAFQSFAGRSQSTGGCASVHFSLAGGLCGFALSCAISPTAHGQCHYTYQQIPNPPGTLQFAYGVTINELGHVAGTVHSLGDTTRAFFWSAETGTYVLPFPPGIVSMEVGDMNDLDVLCGQMYSATRWYGFIWDRESGAYTVVDLPAGATGIEMNGINNAGQIALFLRGVDINPFRWENGKYQALSAPPGGQSPLVREINEIAAVLGYAFFPSSPHAALAPANEFDWLPEPPDLLLSLAFGLSNNGFAAGDGTRTTASDPNYHIYGMLWTPDGFRVIEPPSGYRDILFADVNDAGRAVGLTQLGGPNSAAAWQNERLVDLNTLTLPGTPRLRDAASINNSGQVLVHINSASAVITPVWLPGDLTGDCHVSIEDLVLVLSNFGMPHGTFPRGDADGDGEVDISDLAILLAHWGE